MSGENQKARLLLIDDDDTFRQVMSSELTRRGYTVTVAATGEEALKLASSNEADVTLLDLRLPDMDGIQVLTRLREQNPATGVVLLTGHGTIDTAVQAMRLGAFDYLEKPCPIEKLEMTIHKTYEHVRLVRRQAVLEDGYSVSNLEPDLVGSSPEFRKLLANVDRFAKTDTNTLILGETGVGKEVVATLLHSRSQRSEAPFVVVDCAALHEELLQSELFGHERGAFTGASRKKHGLFEVANSGTLFLDEVGDTSPDIQAKLLRVLETSRFRHLGGTTEIEVDVRIVAATNRDLRKAIARGHFREDLFYRLATLTLKIPPLRERSGDIRELAEHFTAQFNLRYSSSKSISLEAMDILVQYGWPGNIRELIHVIQQAVVLCDQDEIGIADIPESVRRGLQPATAPDELEVATLEELERRHVMSVLGRVEGNRAGAARLLGISERNLYRLLNKYKDAHDDS
ncbi:MAG: sigma-54-dependent Fis family transcriptional regulator [Acidobacteria bacterium]|uniref:Sigma-54-dependent Fis family transcriptional regulator n=1 Tax=Candidatus Polarisedimenticola svalbardensis TaxID=2886004 RepID=A0A8J7CLV7_9BACT|nr:sigma-54-dependent Fis family transcriptional regulator [Candidatus Polarisedimenticola svalbardensis]